MPELPEVETICRGLQKHVIGLKITGVTITLPKIINTTPANFRKVVTGKTIVSAQRRAKIIIIGLSDNYLEPVRPKVVTGSYPDFSSGKDDKFTSLVKSNTVKTPRRDKSPYTGVTSSY